MGLTPIPALYWLPKTGRLLYKGWMATCIFHRKVRKPYYPAFHRKDKNGWMGGWVEGNQPVVLSGRKAYHQTATTNYQPQPTTQPP